MRVWLVAIGEPLPSDGGDDRLLRTGMLAELLASRGHEVVWWTSSFDHARKRQRFVRDAALAIGANYTIRVIRSPSYRRNVGLKRWFSHWATARRFARAAAGQPRPDVIVSCLPTVELCRAAVCYGRRVSTPVVIDIRDLWPDLFVDLAPRILHRPARMLLSPLFRVARRACAGATAIVGVTDEFVNWGLANAGRSAGPFDRSFAMAYRAAQPSSDDLASAERFWDEHGIGVDDNTVTACFFGTLGRHFDIDCVIDAARLLHQRKAPVRFVICGDGERLPRYRRRAQDCSNVLFAGWVGGAEIWSLMRRSSVGLAPYHSSPNFVSNLPNKPIEYLSAGLPIVSSLRGVLARLLAEQGCGLTYENGNAQQLAGMLAELSNQPRRLRMMAERAIEVFKQRFVAERVYAELAAYLAELADRHVASMRHPHRGIWQTKRHHDLVGS